MTDHQNSSADIAELEIWQIISEDVKERIAEGDGMWVTCSGCHESVDGYSIGYPHSKVFGCKIGSGCHECGGIGAVWDTTDYEHMGRTLAAEMLTGAPAQAVGMQAALDFDVEDYVRDYEFRGEGGDYKPTEAEQEVLIDAIHGVLAALFDKPAQPQVATVEFDSLSGARKQAMDSHASMLPRSSADTARPAAAVRAAVIEECALICEANPLNAAALAAVKIRSLISEADRHDQDGQTCPTCGRVGNGEG